MAVNIDWSRLAADAAFCTRAQELLTDALNKSPKPLIIVDDILVNELNLGTIAPNLEILEVGDLAEDLRFRGIVKMCYSGDGFLTLKTRVQANPLNTYLSSTPSFASPEPLAAASGLTIPLKITLSDIKLSAFIILVFSRQKGLTLVFRNDPLESMRVSSTFDSIPFVRDYLQRTIESQLRTLLMDELPAIIHRLSLRFFVPDYRDREEGEVPGRTELQSGEETLTDPLASPPQDPVDLSGHALDAAQIASLSLDSGIEAHSLFSQKNLLRLAALSNSHRTLSLFTPNMRHVIYRAWAGPSERGEFGKAFLPAARNSPVSFKKPASPPPALPIYALSSASETASHSSRPTLSSFGSSFLGRHGRPGKKRKHRVVNLRKTKSDLEETDRSALEGGEDSPSVTTYSAGSEADYAPASSLPEVREGELVTPPSSPETKQKLRQSPQKQDAQKSQFDSWETTPRQSTYLAREQHHTQAEGSSAFDSRATVKKPKRSAQVLYLSEAEAQGETVDSGPFSQPFGRASPLLAAPFPYLASAPGGILEQAWMMKMASEMARRAEEQGSASRNRFWEESDRPHTPPPAYGS